jgi:dolichol-phosphate mannosyltransferase
MFNEEIGARRCLERVSTVVESFEGPVTIVAVDDGSSDSTLQVLKEASADGIRFELVEGGINRGYGGALLQGTMRADALGADWVLFMDSDLTNPPEQIGEFLAAAHRDVDVVKACRYCRAGSTGDVPIKRVLVSRCGNLIARVLTGIPHSDLTNGFRAFRTASYLDLPLTERGFAVILEEMYFARVRHLRVASLPSSLTNRAGDLRPTAFRYTARQLWAYLRWPLRTAAARPRMFFARLGPSRTATPSVRR